MKALTQFFTKRKGQLSILVFLCLAATACTKGGKGGGGVPSIKINVGTESAAFYQEVCDEYMAANPDSFKITVVGEDISTAASTFNLDPQNASEIFTIPHNNLSQLVSDNTAGIRSFNYAELLSEIRENNSDSIFEMIQGHAYDKNAIYGVPYIAQSHVLYYNTDFLSATDVLSWNTILAKATASKVKAFTLEDTSAYNNSFLDLATDSSGNQPIKIFEGVKATNISNWSVSGNNKYEFTANEVSFTSDEAISIFKFGQRLFTDTYGFANETSPITQFGNGKIATYIGGAWKFSAVKTVMGSKLGIAPLPSFTLEASDLYGSASSKTYHSGSYYDAKIFVVKKELPDGVSFTKIQKLLLHLQSKEIQARSLIAVNNLPTYKDAESEIGEGELFHCLQDGSVASSLALAQFGMKNYGYAQKTSIDTEIFDRYYTDTRFKQYQENILRKVPLGSGIPALTTDNQIKVGLQQIEGCLRLGSAYTLADADAYSS